MLHLFDDIVVNQSANLLCGGSTYQQSSIKTAGYGLSERLQELRVESLQIYIQTQYLVVIRCKETL